MTELHSAAGKKQGQNDTSSVDQEEYGSCTGCGLTESRWNENFGAGYVSDVGDSYCCQLCAAGESCACRLRAVA